jgi:Amt family ammonium transporter
VGKKGFIGFAGHTVVHSVGGWAALAGAWMLGPRYGKYDKNGKSKAIPGHNMSLAVIGLFVLWLGWFGFNPGSTMSFQNPGDVVHILATTNTAAIAAVLTATAASWIFIGKPDLGMTINGCLAGLVAITGGCAYVSIGSSLLIGAIAGALVVFAVLLFDRKKIDDPVGATSVHLVCGVFGTLCMGLFAQEGVTSLSEANGLFFGGGLSLLGVEAIGIAAVGAFVFAASLLIWFVLKKTIGIRVTLKEEIEGLDIGEHGNYAYPDFSIVEPIMETDTENGVPAEAARPASNMVTPEAAIPVVNLRPTDAPRPGAKMTKVTVITNQDKLSNLHAALDRIGITGLTVTNVLGHGMQKGHTEYYRGAPLNIRLLPKVQVDIIVCKVPPEAVIDTVKNVLYTGSVGDGKVFVSDVENVIKVRTGEEGYDALQDNE